MIPGLCNARVGPTYLFRPYIAENANPTGDKNHEQHEMSKLWVD